MSRHWAFMERRLILRSDDDIYLTRWRIVSTPWFGVFLHRFDGPDWPTLHDHPWSFASFILRGGYEEYVTYSQKRTINRFNFKHATDQHWINTLFRIPTWTLIFHGQRVRTWGFIDPDGTWTRWDQHEALMTSEKTRKGR